MSMFFGVIGLIGMLVFGAIAGVGAIRKSETGKVKKNFIIAGGCFILFVLGLSIPSPETVETTTEPIEEVEVKEEVVEDEEPEVIEPTEEEIKADEQAKKDKEAEELAKQEAQAKKEAEEQAKLEAEKKAKEEAEAKKKAEEAAKPKTFANAIAEMNPDDVAATIKENAKSNWADDFTMQKFEIDQQTEAYNKLKVMKIDSEEKQGMLDRAFSNWRYDFTMISFEYEQQLKAYNDLQ